LRCRTIGEQARPTDPSQTGRNWNARGAEGNGRCPVSLRRAAPSRLWRIHAGRSAQMRHADEERPKLRYLSRRESLARVHPVDACSRLSSTSTAAVSRAWSFRGERLDAGRQPPRDDDAVGSRATAPSSLSLTARLGDRSGRTPPLDAGRRSSSWRRPGDRRAAPLSTVASSPRVTGPHLRDRPIIARIVGVVSSRPCWRGAATGDRLPRRSAVSVRSWSSWPSSFTRLTVSLVTFRVASVTPLYPGEKRRRDGDEPAFILGQKRRGQ